MTRTEKTHCWIFTDESSRRSAVPTTAEREKQKWDDSPAAVLIGPPLGVTGSSYFFCQADKKKRKKKKAEITLMRFKGTVQPKKN